METRNRIQPAGRPDKPSPTMNKQNRGNGNGTTHTHRTAKVVELVGGSTRSFEDAIKNVLRDAAETTRGITGCDIERMSVKCENGEVKEFRVNVKVAFGIERTPPTDAE